MPSFLAAVSLSASASNAPPPPKPPPPPLSSSPSPRKTAEIARRRLAKEKLKKQEQENRRKESSSKSNSSTTASSGSSGKTPKSALSTSTSRTLRSLSARPKRALGQNFVVDEEVLDKVTRAALGGVGGVKAKEENGKSGVGVLEVGPGTGNLTRRLLDFSFPESSSNFVVSALTAVEKDDALAENLRVTLVREESPRLKLLHADFLEVNLPVEVEALRERAFAAFAASAASASSTSSSSPQQLPRAVVVANLPYNITSDALALLLPCGDSISDVCLMLQDEAAQRLAGSREGDPDWRGASALARYFSEPEVLFKIPARCFLPKPRVDSALVRFRLKRPDERLPRASDERLLRAVIRAAFAQRRKALRNSLGALVGAEEASRAVEAAGLDPLSARADSVGVAQFVAIANAIAEASDPALLVAAAAAAAELRSEGEEEEEEEEPAAAAGSLDER